MLSEENNSNGGNQENEEQKTATENEKNDQDEADGDLLSKFKSQEQSLNKLMQRAQSLVIGDYKSSEDGLKYPEGKFMNDRSQNGDEENERYASSNGSSNLNESADENA